MIKFFVGEMAGALGSQLSHTYLKQIFFYLTCYLLLFRRTRTHPWKTSIMYNLNILMHTLMVRKNFFTKVLTAKGPNQASRSSLFSQQEILTCTQTLPRQMSPDFSHLKATLSYHHLLTLPHRFHLLAAMPRQK